MKRFLVLLCVAFPAAHLSAQSSRPERPTDEQIRLQPKRFPPEMILSSGAPGANQAKLTHSYCVAGYPGPKSLSIKRCEPPPQRFRLISPFKFVAPDKKPAK